MVGSAPFPGPDCRASHELLRESRATSGADRGVELLIQP
jgi:hypothetical protein